MKKRLRVNKEDQMATTMRKLFWDTMVSSITIGWKSKNIIWSGWCILISTACLETSLLPKYQCKFLVITWTNLSSLNLLIGIHLSVVELYWLYLSCCLLFQITVSNSNLSRTDKFLKWEDKLFHRYKVKTWLLVISYNPVEAHQY